MKELLAALAILGALASTAQAGSGSEARSSGGNDRIYGGDNVRPGKGDWAILLRNVNGGFCGGSLIDPILDGNKKVTGWGHAENSRWVLTAAHCLYALDGTPYEPDDLEVLTGTVQLTRSRDGEELRVVAVIEHEGYNDNTLENDIALLLLEKPTKELSNRHAIRLPSGFDTSWINKPYLQTYAMGWGVTEDDHRGSDILQQVRVPLIDAVTCERLYGQAGSRIRPGMICAGFALGEFDSCQGDSGGPLAYKQRGSNDGADGNAVLVGVVSWGRGCALPELPGVYSSTLYFMPWIEAAIQRCEKESHRADCTRRTGIDPETNKSRFLRMISGEIALYPAGCDAIVNGICKLAEPIRYEQKPGLIWESGVWSSDQEQTGTTDGASIPGWAQPIIGKPFDRSYLKTAILHDHYCYEENHVRSWRQTHRMFHDALVDSGISRAKAKVMYFAVMLGGPRWQYLVPGEPCGVGCIKSRMADQGYPEGGDWVPALYGQSGFFDAVAAFHEKGEQELNAISLAEIESAAEQTRKTLMK